MWEPSRDHQYYFTYVMREFLVPPRFKIGYSSDPDQRAKREDRDRNGKLRGEPRLVELCRLWMFRSRPIAICIEQILILQLRKLGFHEEPNNWFAVDPKSLDFVIDAIMPLIKSMQQHEDNVVLSGDARRRDKPYGKHYRKVFLPQLISASKMP